MGGEQVIIERGLLGQISSLRSYKRVGIVGESYKVLFAKVKSAVLVPVYERHACGQVVAPAELCLSFLTICLRGKPSRFVGNV